MKFRSLIIAVVVLATLGGVLYWSQHRQPAEEDAASSTPAAPVIIKVDPAEVTELTIKQKEPVTLAKTAGKWQITQPKVYPADQDGCRLALNIVHAECRSGGGGEGRRPQAIRP